MKKVLGVLAAIVLLTAVAPDATAGMWWQRGDPGSTWQDWTFDDDDDPALPETYFNPYGDPTADLVISGAVHEFDPGWYPTFLGRLGVWHGDFTSIFLNIPNTGIQREYKEVWVEVGFRGELLPHPDYPEYDPVIFRPDLNAWVGQTLIPQDDITEIGRTIELQGDGWKKLLIGWRIYPNPDREEIYLPFTNSGADIDYVYVDTICIPEPATIILFGLGALGLKKRRV